MYFAKIEFEDSRLFHSGMVVWKCAKDGFPTENNAEVYLKVFSHLNQTQKVYRLVTREIPVDSIGVYLGALEDSGVLVYENEAAVSLAWSDLRPTIHKRVFDPEDEFSVNSELPSTILPGRTKKHTIVCRDDV